MHTVCTVLYVHTVFNGCMLCNNSVLNVDEEFVHQCVVTLYGDVIRCASSIMHMFACILLQPDEGADDYKFGRAGKVSCCSNCFCACMLLYVNGGHFSLNVYVLNY